MKRRLYAALAMLAVCVRASVAPASLIENNTDLSAEWTRMPARVAATDSVDAVLYNPAGAVRLGEGTYIWVSNQIMPKSFTHSKGGVEHETTTTTWAVPGLFVMKNGKRWSLFSGATVIGGGGTLNYDNGIILDKASGLTATQLAGLVATRGKAPGPILPEEVTSAWLGGYAGGAFAVNAKLSLSLVGRVVSGSREYKIDGGNMLDYDTSGTGFAPIIGFNYTPGPSWNIGFRHEFRTKVKWDVDTMKGSLAPAFARQLGSEGDTYRKDFPAMTALGVAWKASEALTLASDFNYIWHEEVNWEGDEDDLDNTFEASLAAEYALSETVKISCGYSFAESGIGKEDYSPTLSKNTFHGISAGFMAAPSPGLRFNVGVTKFFYMDETDSHDVTYEKDLWIIGTGMQYTFR